MRTLPHQDQAIVESLRWTRSVRRTANRLGVPEDRVQRVAWMAFGLGVLEDELVDF